MNFVYVGGEAIENNNSKPKLDLAGSKLDIFDTECLCLKSRPTCNQPYIKRNLTLRVYDSGIVSHTSILSWNCPVSIPSFFILSIDKSDCLLLSPPRVCTFFIYIQKLQHSSSVFLNYPCNRPWRSVGLWDVEAPIFCLDNRLTDGGEVVSLTHRLPFTTRKISWYSFLLEDE
jgi:hypothetical protein